ncbi:MAG: 4-alpha-glucanotransferase [Thermoanaerobacterales bacterium]|nr:4-alpha-glucanotransferase [Bacillota bacterium]MDI6906712.1 4-alpha-glucanotransferase [Thermoanaerobacterales bacterium]
MDLLHRLAGLYGIEIPPENTAGCAAREPHVLLEALKALGAPVETLADVPRALRERRLMRWRRSCEPVAVAWDGEPARLELRLPAGRADGTAECRLDLEDGRGIHLTCNLDRLPAVKAASVDGERYEARRLTLPPGLPWGYHRLTLRLPGGIRETLLISAPRRVYVPPAGREAGIWGCFLPLYALRSGRNWGAGDFTDLEHLLRWCRKVGAGMAGTLPLLPAFLDEPFDPSPYAPVSRLFWNEFYLDVTCVPEVRRCREARELLDSPEFRQEIDALREAPLVDYRRVMAAKRAVLERCARRFFTEGARRQADLWHWVDENPGVRDYARFRAAVEHRGTGWPAWPERMRAGDLREGDYDAEAERYHLYVQWLAEGQFGELLRAARRSGQKLYLDFPLGVRADGYDVWRERKAFALGASAGAPPDLLCGEGQVWGFPPLHPERIREQGYRYYIAGLRHHMEHTGVLRLDHVMGLHRLYWVPRGLTAREGVYVRYRAEEFYAILALESRRHRTLIVGEDLGTVPGYVRPAMARHNVLGMYVLQFETAADPRRALRPVPAAVLASLNTHDTPPFAAFWQAKDIRSKLALSAYLYRLGRLDVLTVKARPVLRACLAHLAASPSRVLLVNLEDLWLETEPQNVPGTGDDNLNWRRKARRSLEDFRCDPEVLALLRTVAGLRAGAGAWLRRLSRATGERVLRRGGISP